MVLAFVQLVKFKMEQINVYLALINIVRFVQALLKALVRYVKRLMFSDLINNLKK